MGGFTGFCACVLVQFKENFFVPEPFFCLNHGLRGLKDYADLDEGSFF